MLRKVLVALTASLLVAVGLGAAPARADDGRSGHERARGDYLALGDSVPFGYNPLVPIGSPATSYVGYPEVAAPRLGLRLTNLACPGQTASGFVSATGTDNGCVPFRSVAPLHTSYAGTQLQAAVAFLTAHPRTRLVSISLGANDLFLCRKTTADQCTSPAEVAATLQQVGADLTRALTAIRAVYRGPVVAVTYYTTDFSDAVAVAGIEALNGVLARVVTAAGGRVADGFTPFQRASAPFGGSACAAGLLIKLPTGACDIHPSPAGARLLARALVHAAEPCRPHLAPAA